MLPPKDDTPTDVDGHRRHSNRRHSSAAPGGRRESHAAGESAGAPAPES